MYIAETRKIGELFNSPRRRYVLADEAPPGGSYLCPYCHGIVLLEKDASSCHFVHKCGEDCQAVKDQKRRKESRRHQWMKATVLNLILDNDNGQLGHTYGLEFMLGTKRPDAYVEVAFNDRSITKVAIECLYRNWDDYDPLNLEEKVRYYADEQRAHTLWIVDFDEYPELAQSKDTPVEIPDAYNWIRSRSYGKIYGFRGKQLYSVYLKRQGKHSRLWKPYWLNLEKSLLHLVEPNSRSNIITFSDYTFYKSKLKENEFRVSNNN